MDRRQARSLHRREIAAVFADWALWRDTGRWARLRSRYAMGVTTQRTSFEGPANKLIDRSMGGFDGKLRARHSIGESTSDFLVRLNGDWRIHERIPVYETDRIDAVARK